MNEVKMNILKQRYLIFSFLTIFSNNLLKAEVLKRFSMIGSITDHQDASLSIAIIRDKKKNKTLFLKNGDLLIENIPNLHIDSIAKGFITLRNEEQRFELKPDKKNKTDTKKAKEPLIKVDPQEKTYSQKNRQEQYQRMMHLMQGMGYFSINNIQKPKIPFLSMKEENSHEEIRDIENKQEELKQTDIEQEEQEEVEL